MEAWLWISVGIMAAAIIALLTKIYILRQSAKEMEQAFADRLQTETNTLIDISSNDRYMRQLAESLNVQLRKLRAERHRFQQGDLELKNAVTGISHDLRTPLTAILAYLELLEQEETSETVTRCLALLRNRAELMAQLTEELFRYSVILADKKEPQKTLTDISSVLEESIAAFYSVLKEKGIEPVIRIPQQRILLSTDRSALTRIFANLLSNAAKYSAGDLEIRLTENGEITFTNTAPGLNEIQVGKLFDRFYTVEAARSSTGLGLSIARTLTGQIGGAISAAYENGRLSITVTLPPPE